YVVVARLVIDNPDAGIHIGVEVISSSKVWDSSLRYWGNPDRMTERAPEKRTPTLSSGIAKETCISNDVESLAPEDFDDVGQHTGQ
ncbi:hypothetical protein E4T56_gene16421, partial [Termitomyces sp. T112]